MNKNIIIAVIVLVGFGAVVWFGRPASRENSAASLGTLSAGELGAEEKDFDFGTISMAAGMVKHTFKIKNRSSDPVTIGKMYTSCMCTTSFLSIGGKKFGPYGMPGHGFIPKINEALAPGEEAAVEAMFDPAAHGPAGVGPIRRSITIENNGARPLELMFSAVVMP